MSRVGNQEPTFHHAEKYQRTEGRYAADLSASYDLSPHPWQRGILDDWLAIDDQGKLIHSYCILEVPRQNGKTGVSDPRETWGLIKRGEQILHTAQEFQTAKKAFDRLRKKFGTRKNDPYAEYPELNALVDHYTVSAGQMVLDLINGGHIEFRTRGNNSDMGRGGTFDLVVIDEAQAYTEEQDASLSPLNSAAPSGSPQTILMGTPPTILNGKGYIFSNAIRKIHEKP
jgi:phage terminase large subunit-like protein